MRWSCRKIFLQKTLPDHPVRPARLAINLHFRTVLPLPCHVMKRTAVKVAIQGELGSFSHEAAERMLRVARLFPARAPPKCSIGCNADRSLPP